MKKLFVSVAAMLFWTTGTAQFISGNEFHIASQTLVTIDGLALKPAITNFALRNNTITFQSRAVAGNGGNSIRKVYDFNETVNFTGEAGIVYSSEDLNNNNENVLQLAYADHQGVYHTTPDSRVNLVEHFVSRDFNAENLLKLTAVDASIALPVKLVNFSAQKVEESALLQWSTTEEVSSDHFEVQRSPDGKAWQALGKVNAQGESNSPQHYSFTDSRPVGGDNLYRLKMVDTDGTSALSKMATLRFDGDVQVSVYPNPVSQVLHIQTSGNEVLDSVNISNLAGKVLCRSNEANVKLGTLPAGTYIVEVKMKSGLMSTAKIIRN